MSRSRRKQKSFDISMLSPDSDEMSYLKPRARSPSPSPFDERSREYSESVDYSEYVVEEILITERQYLQDLDDIVNGYIHCTSTFSHVQEETIKKIYGNIPAIYTFHKQFLEELERCDENPVSIAQLFVKHSHEFSIYADYCTNYPNSFSALTELLKDQHISDLYRKQQLILGHGLTIGSYLHKPVQRVLKYHLLLQSLLRHYNQKVPANETNGTSPHCDSEDRTSTHSDQSNDTAQLAPNHTDQSDHTNGTNSTHQDKSTQSGDSMIISSALQCMTDCAHHINEMKRHHEQTMRVRELQATLYNLDRGVNLLELGAIVHEGSLRMYGARSYRHVYLFEKAVLICKIREDGAMNCKSCIMCHNLMLIEQIKQEPRSFHLVPYDNPKLQHTFQAKSIDSKRQWCSLVKKYILESYNVPIPDKTKKLLLDLTGKSETAEKFMKFKSHTLKTHQTPDYIEKKRRKSQPNSTTRGGETLPRIKKRVRKISADARLIPLIFLTPPNSSASNLSESTPVTRPPRPTSCPPIETWPPRPVSCPLIETRPSSSSSLCRHDSIAEESIALRETPVTQSENSLNDATEPETSGLWMRDSTKHEPSQSNDQENSESQDNVLFNNTNQSVISDISIIISVHDSMAEESTTLEEPCDVQANNSTNDNNQRELSAASPCLARKLKLKVKTHVLPKSLAIVPHDRYSCLPRHTTLPRRHSYATYSATQDLTSVCDTSHDDLSIRAAHLRELMKSNTGLDDPTWSDELIDKLKAVRSASNHTNSSQNDSVQTGNEAPVAQPSKQTSADKSPTMLLVSRKSNFIDTNEPRKGRSMEDLIGKRLSMAAGDSDSDDSELSPSYSGENSLKRKKDSRTETSAIRNTLHQLGQRISQVKLRLFKDPSTHHNSEQNLSRTTSSELPIRPAKSTSLTPDKPRRSSLTVTDMKNSFNSSSDLLHDVGINEKAELLKLEIGTETTHDNNANSNNDSPDDLWVKKCDIPETIDNLYPRETIPETSGQSQNYNDELRSRENNSHQSVNGHNDVENAASENTIPADMNETANDIPQTDLTSQETNVDVNEHSQDPVDPIIEVNTSDKAKTSTAGAAVPSLSTPAADGRQSCLRERLMQTMAGLDVVLNGLDKYNHEQDAADDNNNEKLAKKPSLDFWIALEKYIKYGSVETNTQGHSTQQQVEKNPIKEEKSEERKPQSSKLAEDYNVGSSSTGSDSVSQLSSGNSIMKTRSGKVYNMARKYSTRIKSSSQERRLRNQLAQQWSCASVNEDKPVIKTRPNRIVRLRRTPSERLRKFTVVLDSDDEGQGEEIICGSPSPTEREFSPFNFIRNSADSGTDCINNLENDDVYERETMEALESFITTSNESVSNDVIDETTPKHPDYILHTLNNRDADRRRVRVRRCASLPATRHEHRADNSQPHLIHNSTSISDRLHSLKHKISSLTSGFRQDVSSKSSLQRKSSSLVNEMRRQFAQEKTVLSTSQDRVILGEGLVKQAKEKLHVV